MNLDFERAVVVPHDSTYGALDWNLAAPGWGHSTGADISAFAGTTTEFKIANTSMKLHDPVIVDDIVFSPVPIPEPSHVALTSMGVLVLLFLRSDALQAK